MIVAGDIEAGTLWPMVRAVFSQPGSEPGYSILFDATAVEGVSVARKELEEIAQRVETFQSERAGTQLALLVADSPDSVRLVASYAALRTNAPYAVSFFTDRDAAEVFVYHGTSS